jgi:hypothetical protein
VYNHCNICNTQIYFCNIHMKHLQRTFETSETLETEACNVRFSPFFRMMQRRAGERPVLASQRPRMVDDGRWEVASAKPATDGHKEDERADRRATTVVAEMGGHIGRGRGGPPDLRSRRSRRLEQRRTEHRSYRGWRPTTTKRG